jgi:membrane protein DedA with SNARE-associated domain
MAEFVSWMDQIPDIALYLTLSLGAATENFIPAVPADTFIAIGGFLAGAGDLNILWLFGVTWFCNVLGAVVVYSLSHVHGPAFLEKRSGRYLLRRHQMQRMERFYERWGPAAMFLSRFLPGVRAITPVFAGATRQPWPRVIVPIGLASALWYGGLLRLGFLAGENLTNLETQLSGLNRGLTGIAVLAALALAVWWYRSRVPGC